MSWLLGKKEKSKKKTMNPVDYTRQSSKGGTSDRPKSGRMSESAVDRPGSAASIPGDDYGWLSTDFDNNTGKIYELLGLEETNENHVKLVKSLLTFLDSRGYSVFSQLGEIDKEDLGDLQVAKRNKELKISDGTWASFKQLRKAIIVHVADKKAIEQLKRMRRASAAAAVDSTLSPEAILQNTEQTLAAWWDEQDKQDCKLENVELEVYKLHEKLQRFNAGKSNIVINPTSKTPSLLLSNLPPEKPCDIEEDLLKSVETTIAAFFGASGIGKTRRVFEILSRKFGFYCTASFDTASNPTSNDFAHAVQRMTDDVNKISVEDDADGSRILGVVRNHVELLLFIRTKVFNFLRSKWPSMTPFQWLLVQLYPTTFLGTDIFDDLYQLSAQGLNSSVSGILVGAKDIRHLVFVDEAQLLQSKLLERFPSESDKQNGVVFNRSLLSAVAKAFRSAKSSGIYCAVLTGTGFRMAEGSAEIASGAGKSSAKSEFSNMYPLDCEGVRAYMDQYFDTSKFEPNIVEHCVKWLVGRPRWTASFLERFMHHFKPENVTKTQADFLFRFFDRGNWEKLYRDDITSAILFQNINEYVDVITDSDTSRFSGYIDTAYTLVKKFVNRNSDSSANVPFFRNTVFQYACSSGVPVTIILPKKKKFHVYEFVEKGVCLFNKLVRKESKKPYEAVELYEPLIVQASINFFGWINLVGHRAEITSYTTGPSGRGESFEHGVAPIFMSLFNQNELSEHPVLNGMKLTEEFDHEWRVPATSYGVMIVKNSSKESVAGYVENVSNSLFEGQFPPLSTTDTNFGSDLIGYVVALVENNLKRKWCNTQIKKRESMDANGDFGAFLTTIPELIWMNNRAGKYMRTKSKIVTAKQDIVIQQIRKFGGVFCVVIKTCKTIDDSILKSGCFLRGKLVSDMSSYKIARYDESVEKQPACDLLLVVDKTSLPVVLKTNYDEESISLFEGLLNIDVPVTLDKRPV